MGDGDGECQLRALRAIEFGVELLGRASGCADHHIGPFDRSLPPGGQIGVADIALDLADVGFGETLLLRTCEAKVSSNAAVGDARITESADLFCRFVDHTVLPEFRVEPVEPVFELGIVLKEVHRVGRWREPHSTTLQATAARAWASIVARPMVNAAASRSERCIRTAPAISSVIE